MRSPCTIVCDVSPSVDRFDLLVGCGHGTVYRLAAVQGLGGLVRGDMRELQRRLRAMSRVDGDVDIVTQWGGDGRYQRVSVPHKWVGVIAHYPAKSITTTIL